MQVKSGQIDQLLWTPRALGRMLIAEVVSSRDPEASVISIIIAFNAFSLQPVTPQQQPQADVDIVYRNQLGCCKFAHADPPAISPPYLYAIRPSARAMDPNENCPSTLTAIDSSSLLVTPSPASHYCRDKDWISSDGSTAVLYDASADQMAFRIFTLPALQMQAKLNFPPGHPVTSSPPSDVQALIAWAPSGQHVAVLWDVSFSYDEQATLGPLTTHDASSGDAVCSCHPWEGTSRRLYQFSCTWSLSSDTVLLLQLPNMEIPELGGSFWLCKLDGQSMNVSRSPEVCLERALFSPCGRFISCDYIPYLDVAFEGVHHECHIFAAASCSELFACNGWKTKFCGPPMANLQFCQKPTICWFCPSLEK